MIYADNAATTRLDTDALHAMLPWLQDEFGNSSQPYSFARAPRKAISDARELIASCIGANADEIYFTSGGTESDNWAISGTLDSAESHIITSKIEHHAALRCHIVIAERPHEAMDKHRFERRIAETHVHRIAYVYNLAHVKH